MEFVKRLHWVNLVHAPSAVEFLQQEVVKLRLGPLRDTFVQMEQSIAQWEYHVLEVECW